MDTVVALIVIVLLGIGPVTLLVSWGANVFRQLSSARRELSPRTQRELWKAGLLEEDYPNRE